MPNPSAADADEAAKAGVHSDFGWALATVLREYVRRSDAALCNLPGGARAYRLLAAVARDCPRSQLALAQHVGLDRTVVTYLLDDLETAGLLARQPDPADRRARRVAVTADGVSRLEALDSVLGSVECDLFAVLDDADRATLRSLLGRLATGLVDRGADPCPTSVDAGDAAGRRSPTS